MYTHALVLSARQPAQVDERTGQALEPMDDPLINAVRRMTMKRTRSTTSVAPASFEMAIEFGTTGSVTSTRTHKIPQAIDLVRKASASVGKPADSDGFGVPKVDSSTGDANDGLPQSEGKGNGKAVSADAAEGPELAEETYEVFESNQNVDGKRPPTTDVNIGCQSMAHAHTVVNAPDLDIDAQEQYGNTFDGFYQNANVAKQQGISTSTSTSNKHTNKQPLALPGSQVVSHQKPALSASEMFEGFGTLGEHSTAITDDADEAEAGVEYQMISIGSLGTPTAPTDEHGYQRVNTYTALSDGDLRAAEKKWSGTSASVIIPDHTYQMLDMEAVSAGSSSGQTALDEDGYQHVHTYTAISDSDLQAAERAWSAAQTTGGVARQGAAKVPISTGTKPTKNDVGRRCTVDGYAVSGIIRFVGQKTDSKSSNADMKNKGTTKNKLKVGVELDAPIGKNNGTVQGVEYFQCAPQHGVLVPIAKCHLV